MANFKTKTTEQYKQELLLKNRPFICREEYLGANTKILHECLKCGYGYMQTPHVILRSGVCPNCSGTINSLEKYIEILKECRPDMTVVGEYKDRQTAILHRHSCGYEYMISPNKVLNKKHGEGCPNCYRLKRRKTDKEFREEIKDIIPRFKYIGKYQGANVKIKIVCNNGHEYYTYPYNIIKGHGCKQCVSDAHGLQCRLTQEEYNKRIKSLYPNIVLLSDYVTSDSPISYKCNICGITAIANRAYSLLSYGCNCNRPSGEKVIANYLTNLGIEFIPQIKFDGLIGASKKLSYDFYIPFFNLLIEYQGAQHERPVEYFGGEKQFKIQKEHDELKKKYAEEHGYDILYIWYYDYDNIEQILDKWFKLESVETAG